MHAVNARLAGALVAIAAASVLAVTAAHAQQFTMKLSQPTINDVVHEYYKTLKAGVEARAGGRIKLEIYPANQLGQLPAVVEGVALGTIEAGSAANGFWVSLEPRFQVLDAPGLFDDVLHGNKVVNDPAIRSRLATFGKDKGVEILAPGVYSPMMLLTHKGVRAVADFQGQKVRTQGGAPIQVEPFKKLGVLPVSLPLGEALPAMQNRTIDGMIAGVAPFTAFKYYDIAKPLTYLPSTTLVAPILVNRQFMKSLGSELEAIVREEGRKAEVLFTDWNVADIKRAEEVWRKNGGELITLPPAEAKPLPRLGRAGRDLGAVRQSPSQGRLRGVAGGGQEIPPITPATVGFARHARDPGIHRKKLQSKRMDCRVKPGNDAIDNPRRRVNASRSAVGPMRRASLPALRQMRSKLLASTTAVHLAMSSTMRARNSSGVVGLGSLPSARRRSTTVGSLRMATTSAFKRSTIAAGSPAGASRPCQPVAT